MIIIQNKEIEYLLHLIRCALLGETPEKPENIDNTELFRLAKAQQVYNLVLPALEKGGCLSEEERKEWNNYRLTELKRTIIVNNERAQICTDLDKAEIPYMFLKGLVIREYYPESFMRQMSDNDILYDKTRRNELLKIMKKHGFYLGTASENSDDFYKKPFCAFEMHRDLFFEESEFCPDLNPWQNAVRESENSSKYNISKEDNYIYALAHLYKHHFYKEGCGVRFLCDFYLLNKKDNLDREYINNKLKDYGIYDFDKTVCGLAEVLFEDKEPKDNEKELLDFMFEGGVYGKSKRDIASEIEQHGGKLGFLIYRLFPSKKEMKAAYKSLEKRPYLLPFYYIYRLFDKYKHNKDKMLRDLNELKK